MHYRVCCSFSSYRHSKELLYGLQVFLQWIVCKYPPHPALFVFCLYHLVMRTHYFAISITISLWDTGADNSVPESQIISNIFTNPFDQFNQKSYSFTNMTFIVDTPDMIAKKYQGKWFLGWCMVISNVQQAFISNVFHSHSDCCCYIQYAIHRKIGFHFVFLFIQAVFKLLL